MTFWHSNGAVERAWKRSRISVVETVTLPRTVSGWSANCSRANSVIAVVVFAVDDSVTVVALVVSTSASTNRDISHPDTDNTVIVWYTRV